MKKRAHLLIGGRVQGVCYRVAAREEACKRGLTGWVKNLRDGNVEIAAEGLEEQLADFAEWCRSGPPLAKVADVKAQYSEASGEWTTFDVRS